MSELICTKCNMQSPEKALYCQHCGQPLLCKNCRTPLLSTARACIQCGQLIPERSSSEQIYVGVASTTPPGYSRLKWHETPEVRDLDLTVANDSIEHIRDFFPILVDNRLSRRPKSPVDYQVQQQTELVEVTQEALSVRPQLAAASLQPAVSQEGIWEIFRDREGRLREHAKITSLKQENVRE